MQEAYVNISGIPTHIMCWGKWIEESFTDEKQVVICITGNPGLPGYYAQFMSTIHNNIEKNIPVWVIGQVGHDDPPAGSIRTVPLLEGNEKKFDLDAQIKHKTDFIETYVPENVKIHLIGHSIGAWMTVKLLENPRIKSRVQKCYLLFPTVERMKDTPNGKRFTRFVAPFYFFLRYFIMFFNMLPNVIKLFLIYVYFMLSSISQHFLGTTVKYLQPAVMDRVVFLARDEMDRINALDEDLVRRNKHLLKFYYGTTDGWVPVKYYVELKEKIPDIDAVLDNKDIFHTFVLRSSVEMGTIVAEWIRQYSI